MPTINTTQLKFKVKHKRKDNTSAKLYQNAAYKRIRAIYMQEHPLCEMCIKNNIIKAATDLHHIKPILSGTNEQQRLNLLLDDKNYMALCEECHHKIHNKNNGQK